MLQSKFWEPFMYCSSYNFNSYCPHCSTSRSSRSSSNKPAYCGPHQSSYFPSLNVTHLASYRVPNFFANSFSNFYSNSNPDCSSNLSAYCITICNALRSSFFDPIGRSNFNAYRFTNCIAIVRAFADSIWSANSKPFISSHHTVLPDHIDHWRFFLCE